MLNQRGLLALNREGATLVILDNSASMGYRDEGGERFERAKNAAREILPNLSGRILVIPMASVRSGTAAEEDRRWTDGREAAQILSKIPLFLGRGNSSSALRSAFQALKDAGGPGNILIVTDLTRGDWEDLDLSEADRVSAETGIAILRIGGPKRDSNLLIKGVRLAEGEAVAGGSARLEVTVANDSDGPASSNVGLVFAGEKKDQKNLELKAGEEQRLSFDVFFEKPGWLDGEVRLAGDFMPLDDSFYFALQVKEKMKVLIVEGNPRRSLKASESYYLVNALNPGRGEEAAFLPQVVTENELSTMDIRGFGALFLVNVAKPQGSRIASFLESGKPVFLFPGDRISPEEYQAIPLFPWRLRPINERERQKPQKIAQIDFNHEALKGFLTSGAESLKGASFRRYYRIEGSTKTLLGFENGDPFLVQADMGKGKFFLFASSAGLDWNDLALKAGYLPLIQGLLKEATGLAKESSPQSVPFGRHQDGKSLTVQVRGEPGGLGVYKSFGETGEFWRGVNLPIEESNLTKMTDAELNRKFGNLRVKVAEYQGGASQEVGGGRKELWPYLLGFLLIVLGVEMGVANRI